MCSSDLRASSLEAAHPGGTTAEGYAFLTELVYRLSSRGARVVETPIIFRDRERGVSKMSGSIVREALVLVARLWVGDFKGRRRRRAEGG